MRTTLALLAVAALGCGSYRPLLTTGPIAYAPPSCELQLVDGGTPRALLHAVGVELAANLTPYEAEDAADAIVTLGLPLLEADTLAPELAEDWADVLLGLLGVELDPALHASLVGTLDYVLSAYPLEVGGAVPEETRAALWWASWGAASGLTARPFRA